MPADRPSTAASLRSVFTALVLAMLFRSTAVQAFNIPSGSATPTLLTGDTVLVSNSPTATAGSPCRSHPRCSTAGCSARRRRVATWWCSPTRMTG